MISTSKSAVRQRFSIASVATAVLLLAGGTLTACASGEGAGGEASGGGAAAKTLTIDFATYNPLSLVLKEKGWLEKSLADKNITVSWIQSAGSNKANEALRSGAADVASTAGSAALLARANGSPIKTIDIYSQPEWSALVTTAKTKITSVADLKGKSVAATKGTDPYFFLIQALGTAGLSASDVTVQNLQHADGWTALSNGSVDAWSGLDPIMANAETKGAKLFYRNVKFNSYGFLNATEKFLSEQPDTAQVVVNAYEKARAWAQQNPQETAKILAKAAGLDETVAKKVIDERTNLDVDPKPGAAQRAVLQKIGPIFVQLGDVSDQAKVDAALDSLLDPTYVDKADPGAIAS